MPELYHRPGGAVNSPGNRRLKSRRGQKILSNRLKDNRLLLPEITDKQRYSPLSSSASNATCSKTWDGGPHGSHEDCKAYTPSRSASRILTETGRSYGMALIFQGDLQSMVISLPMAANVSRF